MVRVVGIDHLVIRVSDYDRSKQFYDRLFTFLEFEISDEYEDMIGWTNGKTRFWISRADEQGREPAHRHPGERDGEREGQHAEQSPPQSR